MTDFQVSRRAALLGGAAVASAGSLAQPGDALAKAPQLTTQTPYFYRFPLGKMQITMVSSSSDLPSGRWRAERSSSSVLSALSNSCDRR